jgi:aspartate carbamoyltransferase catalytic subunit
LAGKRLSADVVNVKGSGSSMEKGETLKDTVITLSSYLPDVIVIRHASAGACRLAQRHSDAAIVNAGDGKGEHPTQTLLDLYTIRREVGALDGLHIAFVGDVAHSRVARSGAVGFAMMGAKVSFIGPPTLIPRDAERAFGVSVSHDVRDIADADIVYVLRMQLERMGPGGFVPSLREYAATFGINHARLRAGQRVMHAGPINRGVEISGELADDPLALIERQAANGMVVRMAVLYDLLAAPAGAVELGQALGAVA